MLAINEHHEKLEFERSASLMSSTDYKERFIAEYIQLRVRRDRLSRFLTNWDNGALTFEPTCPRSIYGIQLRSMDDYLAILEARMVIEGIDYSYRDEKREAEEE